MFFYNKCIHNNFTIFNIFNDLTICPGHRSIVSKLFSLKKLFSLWRHEVGVVSAVVDVVS